MKRRGFLRAAIAAAVLPRFGAFERVLKPISEIKIPPVRVIEFYAREAIGIACYNPKAIAKLKFE